MAQGFRPDEMCTAFLFYPKGYGVPLLGVYAVWALLIATLYPLCRWVAGGQGPSSRLVAQLSVTDAR